MHLRELKFAHYSNITSHVTIWALQRFKPMTIVGFCATGRGRSSYRYIKSLGFYCSFKRNVARMVLRKEFWFRRKSF